ncbi:hypothetical protein ACIQI7_09120 [Kitasatospora sp. NPDC092039]|uniref:hypothetical protein n=1 Tax=Kitasatospora sp. NPDC092039 TaxID=3364086 RepID=UPI003813CF3D
MIDHPTPEQLDRLLSTADRRRLTPAEAALLRMGLQHLQKAAARPPQPKPEGQPIMEHNVAPITVDAEPYITRLRTQMAEAWGQVQAQLALAHEENAVRAAREAEQARRIAELEATVAELQASASTRP